MTVNTLKWKSEYQVNAFGMKWNYVTCQLSYKTCKTITVAESVHVLIIKLCVKIT